MSICKEALSHLFDHFRLVMVWSTGFVDVRDILRNGLTNECASPKQTGHDEEEALNEKYHSDPLIVGTINSFLAIPRRQTRVHRVVAKGT